MKRLLITMLLGFLMAESSWCQNPDSPRSGTNGSTPASPLTAGYVDTSEAVSPATPWLPTALNGETGSLAFESESARSNLLSSGLTLVTSYDGNALSNNAHRVGNVGLTIVPNISLSELRGATLIQLNYGIGLTQNQRLSPERNVAQNLDLNLQYRFTERLTARIHEALVYNTTSFDRLSQDTLQPGGSVLHQSNQSAITPLATSLNNLTGLDLIYQLGERTIVGGSGYFTNLHFVNNAVASSTQLLDNQSVSADAFYSTRFSQRQAVGVTYSLQKLTTFSRVAEHTSSDRMLLFYTLYPTPGVMLSFFAGPDRVTTHIQPITLSNWFTCAGATLGWQGQRTSAQVSFVHDVTDGGGLTGTVRTSSVTVNLRRRFTPKWAGDVSVNYGKNDPLVFDNSFYGVTAIAGVQRTVGERLLIGMRYARQYQYYETSASLAPRPSVSRNIVWFSIAFRFVRPLGI
jgi:hypothetical protein